MANTYHDRFIECTDAGVTGPGLLLPLGDQDHPLRVYPLVGPLHADRPGGARPASGDRATCATGPTSIPSRPKKSVGFFVDVGRRVVPFLTPDDPDAFERVVAVPTGLAPPDRQHRSLPSDDLLNTSTDDRVRDQGERRPRVDQSGAAEQLVESNEPRSTWTGVRSARCRWRAGQSAVLADRHAAAAVVGVAHGDRAVRIQPSKVTV